MAKISIIIPAYNAAQDIGNALDSVLKNESDMDIVVIDDASSDDTCSVVEQYMSRHSNIRLLRNEANTGPGVARNRALMSIDSEYCMFHDADDTLVNGAVDILTSLMDRADVDFAVFNYFILRNRGAVLEEGGIGAEGTWQDALGGQELAIVELDKAPNFLLMVNYPWNKIFRTSFIRRVNLRFSTARINEDILPHWAAFMHAGRFLAVNRKLTIHSLIAGSDQHTNVYDERRIAIFEALRETESIFERNKLFRDKYYHLFLYFKAGLLGWALSRVRPDLRRIFDEHVTHSYRGFTDEDFKRIYQHSPDLALTILKLKYSPAGLGTAA